ncbi:hypothetical protein VTI74DRAFT_11031 [Chaetomium olivicolor]
MSHSVGLLLVIHRCRPYLNGSHHIHHPTRTPSNQGTNRRLPAEHRRNAAVLVHNRVSRGKVFSYVSSARVPFIALLKEDAVKDGRGWRQTPPKIGSRSNISAELQLAAQVKTKGSKPMHDAPSPASAPRLTATVSYQAVSLTKQKTSTPAPNT